MADLDLMDAASFRDGIPHEYFRELRHRDGLPRAGDEFGNEFWYAVRHRDVAMVSRDAKTFSSSPTTMTSLRDTASGFPIITFMDAPEHTRMRRLTFKAFAPARLAAMEPAIRDMIGKLMDAAFARDEFDLADDIALRLPFEVLAEMLDLPHEEREMVIGWAIQTINLGDPEFEAPPSEDGRDVFRMVYDYLQDLARRRAEVSTGDLFSTLVAAEVKGEKLTLDEIGTFASTLVTAGSETTYCSLTGGIQALLENPDQLALLRADRSLLPKAVDEILRWVTPVTHFARTVTTDTEVGGQEIRAGERIVVWYSSANRDETVFAEPDRFDITRSPNPHLTFGGGGPHVCIGNGLATLELRLFLDMMLDHLPTLELAAPPERAETNFMNAVKHLRLRRR